MTTELAIQIISLLVAAGVPTVTFIYNFGQLNNEIKSIKRDNERFDQDVRELRGKFDQLLFYFIDGKDIRKK